MTTLRIKTAEVFAPLLKPARYKGAWGGRGSGKSLFFGGLGIEKALSCPGDYGEGLRMVCIREVQKTLATSSKQIIQDMMSEYRLGEADGFKVYEDRIKFPKDGLCIFTGMKSHTADSIKSLQGFRVAWTDEAQSLSARSLSLLRPTIREKDSELWFSWNARRKSDAVDDFFRGNSVESEKNGWTFPDGAVVVKANWRDNPWFNEVLEAERQIELRNYPERYDHTWEGGYAKAFEGAYFAGVLAQARQQGRIVKNLTADPLLPLRVFIDIGGAGATADAFTMWVVQWVDERILVLDYYEAVGQVLAAHVAWIRKNGYENAIFYLPHDGVATNNITGKRYEDHLREAGLTVEPPVANQGRGAASMRIEAVRRLGPKLWFDEAKTEPGRDALGSYHEKRDPDRNIGLGPEHDWSSHGADSFGLMCVCYEPPRSSANFNRKISYGDSGWR